MVLFDSSVWVAFFNQNDIHHEKAQELFIEATQQKEIITVPEFVYAEVLNSLWRITNKEDEIERCKNVFLQGTPIIQLELGGSKFWYQTIESVMKKVSLKTSDLIVASTIVYYQSQRFETFDRILQREVDKLSL
ncbi:MAG: PIN domain-containing protein [Bacteroidetes bacterium]|nr:MAG: PIN domain-containing protein [Bacteroidota bacterium]